QKSRDAKRVADIKQIQTALELYYNDNNGYPLQADVESGNELSINGVVYMNAIPSAPTPADGECTGTQNSYSYTQISSGASYTISYCLGAATGEVSSGVNEATPAGISAGN
ncbi:MAG: type II secretion system protein GspG, partial [Candidatus Pacebacteria bacterium]|nr:type II secretion system protein GspG [Candidatus Paceibacterota bacterium]